MIAHFTHMCMGSSQPRKAIWATHGMAPAPKEGERTGEVGTTENPSSLMFATEFGAEQTAMWSVMLSSGHLHYSHLQGKFCLDEKKKTLWEAGKDQGWSVQPDFIAVASGTAGGCQQQLTSSYLSLFAQGFLWEPQHCLLKAALRVQGYLCGHAAALAPSPFWSVFCSDPG